MYAQLTENRTDISVERKLNLGGTLVTFPALEKGDVDMYFEYSGTAYSEILKLSAEGGRMSSGEVYEQSKQRLDEDYGITMFQPIGINNTYALAMPEAKASELGVKTMGDLSGHAPDLRFGANHLFYTRVNDGYDTMVALYGYEFRESLKMDTSLLYEAIPQDQLDVIVVYATDSLLKKYDMAILQDDQELFPAYHGAPVCRNDTLEKYPELNGVFDLLAGKIDDTLMQDLNYQIDVENKTPEEVAKAYLTEQGLLE
jgi:glycine betaine/choline ABC-type transport system substrate-binding protein